MPWVRFTEAYDFLARERLVVAYKKGREYLVKRSCADDAVAKGKAVLIERPQWKRANAGRRSQI